MSGNGHKNGNESNHEAQRLRKEMQFIAAAFTTYVKFPFGYIDYHMVAEDMKELSGAAYVVFNIISENGDFTITKAIAGVSEHIKKASKLLGSSLIDRQWSIEPLAWELTRNRHLTALGELPEVTKHTPLNRSLIRFFQSIFSISETYGIGIQHEGKPLGNFILFMPRNFPEIADSGAIELFASQTSTLMLRKRAEQNFEQLNREYETVFSATHDAIMLINVSSQREFSFLRINRAFELLTGIPEHEAAGKTAGELFGREEGAFLEKQYAACFREKKPLTYEQSFLGSDHRLIFHTALTPVIKEGRVVYLVSSSRDITEQKQKEAQIIHMSIHDSLTGLFNRTYYQQSLQELDAPDFLPLSVIIADINGLKLVNDAFGHGKGDMLIQRAAQVINRHVRDLDRSFRIGGDEFALLLPQCGFQEAKDRADTIQKEARSEAIGPVNVSIALGYHTKTSSEEHLEAAVQQAESMMYANKLHESKRYRSETVALLIKTLELRQMGGSQYISRIRCLAHEIAVRSGMYERELEKLDLFARFHDIGKSAVPPDILNKPNQLSSNEWIIMSRHCEVGYRIANTLPELSEISDWILTHHEWYNGRGYPQGLQGEDIPLPARIIAVCEAFAAMTLGTVYKKPLSIQETLDELKDNRGEQFDPTVVDHLIDILSSRPDLISDSQGVQDSSEQQY